MHGSKALHTFPHLACALVRFHSIYERKTGNKFHLHTFHKQRNKFHHLDIEMKVAKPNKVRETFDATKLDARLYDLMQMLFDVKKIEHMMYGCDLNLTQLPLGKMRSNQIQMAMFTLQNIETLIRRNAPIHELRGASNEFYTLIPHVFGFNRPPTIDSIEMVSIKHRMLQNLMNMRMVYRFLGGQNGEKTHPLDVCYRKLNVSIVPIAQYSDEYRLFCEIVRNTHVAHFTGFELEVLDIFKVERDGEAERFDWKLRNHELLWHGSPLPNFANILANGLKAVPKEAPTRTVRAFGNGIYFSDMISKAADYCYTDHSNDIGLVLLCEVALGIPKEMKHFSKVADIPNEDHQSVKGLGSFAPCEYRKIDGVNAAYRGKSNESLCLRYNEFIVFDPNQVKIKYLFKMKIHKHN